MDFVFHGLDFAEIFQGNKLFFTGCFKDFFTGMKFIFMGRKMKIFTGTYLVFTNRNLELPPASISVALTEENLADFRDFLRHTKKGSY